MYINSTYSILYLDFGNGFLPIGCLTQTSFTENVETLETTTKENNGWKTNVLTSQGFSLSFSGLSINTLYNGGDFTKYSYDVLKTLKRNRALVDYQIKNLNTGNIESGKCQITDLSGNYNLDEFESFEGTLLGYGQPTSTNENPIDTGLESQLETLI